MKLKEEELITVSGGAFSITGSLIAAIVDGINTILDVGRSLGTAIRFFVSKRRC